MSFRRWADISKKAILLQFLGNGPKFKRHYPSLKFLLKMLFNGHLNSSSNEENSEERLSSPVRYRRRSSPVGKYRSRDLPLCTVWFGMYSYFVRFGKRVRFLIFLISTLLISAHSLSF